MYMKCELEYEAELSYGVPRHIVLSICW